MMMQAKDTSRIYPALSRAVLFLFSAAVIVTSGFVVGVVAQETQPQKPVVTTKKTYGGRDPFRKYEPPRPMSRPTEIQSPIPTIDARLNQYRAQKAAAMNARMQAPKPTTALLLSEIQVIGISRSPRGYAAIIEATPIKLTYVIYPGEPFFDGQLVAIEDNRLVFRRETVFTNGRRERAVEYKQLRQPTPVNAMPTPGAVATAKP
ncbi:MAG TPA: hypothetical protein VFP64_16320 [Pyrinomonadaceae bacterium]|nr:hypothetical protein [Pyrinomonadaceae bacterium]